MKILIVARGYPTKEYPTNGIFEFDQARALANLGHNVIYAAIDTRSIRRKRKWGFTSQTKDGIRVESISLPVGNIPEKFQDRIRSIAFSILYKRIVANFGTPDIVHAHFIHYGYMAANLCKREGLPLVITEHSSLMNKRSIEEKLEKKGRYAYSKADKVVAVSNYLKNNIKKNFGIESIVIPNIVDLSNFKYKKKSKSNTFTFVSIGNLLPNKNMKLLINSFCGAFKDNSEVKLFIYGDGPERRNLNSQIKKNKMENNIFLMGKVPRKVIAEKLCKSNCFVLASKQETFGVAFIEALSLGLPVISTNSGGPEDIINKSNGLIVKSDDVEALKRALLYMYNYSDAYQEEKIAGDVEKLYSPQVIGERLVNLYQNILYR